MKIKADANPYSSEYAAYFWRRRHDKSSKLLAALSARQLRDGRHKETKQAGRPPRVTFKMLEPGDGKLSSTVLRGKRGCKAPDLLGVITNSWEYNIVISWSISNAIDGGKHGYIFCPT